MHQPRPIPALTLTQPWATLVAIGAKHAETRSWRPTGAGAPPWPLAVHAAKTLPGWARVLCAREPFASVLAAAGYADPTVLPLGAVVAVCAVVDVHATAGTAPPATPADDPAGWAPAPYEHAFGDYTPGRWAWLLDQVTRLAAPVPARGARGLWTWTPPASLPPTPHPSPSLLPEGKQVAGSGHPVPVAAGPTGLEGPRA